MYKALVMLALPCFGLCLNLTAVQQETPLDTNKIVGDIIKTWKDREQNTPSFKVTWKIRHTYTKGSLLNEGTMPRLNPNKVLAPLADHSFDTELTFKCSGKKTRYEFEWDTWDTLKNAFTRQVRTELFDGQTNTTFVGRQNLLSTASIRPEANDLTTSVWQNRAFILALRPSTLPTSELNMENLILAPKREMIGNNSCYVLKAPKSPWKYWVDPQQGFAVMKCAFESKNGEILRMIEIQWRKDKDVLLPERWHMAKFSVGGQLLQHTTSTDVKFEIPYLSEPTEFELTPPANTFVFDGKAKKGEPKRFIVDSENVKRPVSAKELSEQHWTELVKPRTQSSWIFLAIGLLFAVVGLGALVAWKRGFFFSMGGKK